MEPIDIINEVKKILPSKYQNATITVGETDIPFYSFLEQNFINFIKPEANPTILVSYIQSKLSNLIEFDNKFLVAIENFINSAPLYKDTIQLSESEIISARTYLSEYCIKHGNPDGTINYAGKTTNIEELYLKLLGNEYKAPTLEDKAELCIDMTRYIDLEILNSIVDGYKDITVYDYICQVLPTKMCSISEVMVRDTKMPLEGVVAEIVNHQRSLLEKACENERLAREEEYNKTSDNPGLVSEIKVFFEGNNLEVTAEIPIVTSSLLTEEEKISLLKNYEKRSSITEEDHYLSELNYIKNAIDNTTSDHNLDSKEEFYRSILGETDFQKASEQVRAVIESIEELIIVKRNHLIKVTNNQEEYTDVLFSEINRMNDELDGFQTLDQHSVLYGKIHERYQEFIAKCINDVQLKNAFHNLFKNIAEKRLILEATIGYQSPEVERAKVDIETAISEIKQDILTIEHDANNLGNLAGTAIRLNLNIKSARDKVEAACQNKLLTEDDREYYNNRLNVYSIALESEKKIGYGLR